MPRRTTNDPAIAQRIRDRRTLLGWTVRFAADRAGISHSTWSRIERGTISADNRGQVLLTRAFCLYALDRRDDAQTSVADAQQVADRTGDTTTLGMMFGPTNIKFWGTAMEADGDALRMLLTAERLAPQQTRDPLVRETARGLLERARRGTDWTKLRGLCERVGA